MHDYEERMKLKKLTAVEIKEWEALKIEHARYLTQLAEAERHEEETRAARRAEAMRLALVGFPNMAARPWVRAEFAIHSYREALLARLRSVAVADGRTDLIVRIDALMQREGRRHEQWILVHRGGQ
jgi:hypothetical protein